MANTNIYGLYQYAITKTNTELSKKIQKLYDHIILDVARINYVKAIDNRYMKSRKELNVSLNDTVEKLDSTKEELDEYEEKVDNAQKESITILGIFSAVILAFIGGMTFTSSVLSNINSVSIYRLLILFHPRNSLGVRLYFFLKSLLKYEILLNPHLPATSRMLKSLSLKSFFA